jgi:transposase
MRKVVGLDISLKKIAVCVLGRDGQLVWQGKVDAEPGPLAERLRPWRDEIDLVGLEACPLSEWLHRHLVADGYNAVCVETRQAQRFLSTRPVKTDRNDARGIAEMMRIGHYRPVHVKSAEAQLVRTILQARRQIVASLLQMQGSIRGLLRMHGLKVGEIHRNRFENRARDLLEEMPSLACAIEPLLRILERLTAERKALDKRLEQTARSDAVRQRLMSIPGVGPITSLAFRVTVDDPSRFDSSKAVGAHLGLTPRVYQSGETDRSGQISKAGDHMLRHLLYEAASALMTRCRQPSRLRAWGIAIARRRGAKRARVAVARKLAVIMQRMWVSGSEFQTGMEKARAAA